MTKPTKIEMKQIAERLERKSFHCEIETQGNEHIVRCNWNNTEILPNGNAITVSVIPKTIDKIEILDVIMNVGNPFNQNGLNSKFIESSEAFDKLMQSKGFELHNKSKKGNFPIEFRGIKKISKITDNDIEDINSFVNLYASKMS